MKVFTLRDDVEYDRMQGLPALKECVVPKRFGFQYHPEIYVQPVKLTSSNGSFSAQ
jgi:hypothetical protein